MQIVTAGTPEGHSDRGAIKFTLVEGTADAADPGTSAAGQPIWNNLPTGPISALPADNLTRPSVADPNDPGPQPQLAREAMAPAKPLLDKPAVDPLGPDNAPAAVSQAQHTAMVAAAPIDAPAPSTPQPAASEVRPDATVDRQPLSTPPTAASSGPPDGTHGGGQPLVQVPGPESLVPATSNAGDGSAVHIASTVDPQAHPAPAVMTPVSLPTSTSGRRRKAGRCRVRQRQAANRIDVATSGSSPTAGSAAIGRAFPGRTARPAGTTTGGDKLQSLIVPVCRNRRQRSACALQPRAAT